MENRPELLPLALPQLGEEEIVEAVACLRSGWITSGPRVRELEEAFAAAVGAEHAVAVSSGTAALHLALLALGVGSGDEVVMPPLTWPSAANMVLACGALPVFADVDPRTWNLSVEAAAAALTPRTRVVMPVHFAGQPADLASLAGMLEAAGRPDVSILEDAAHAAGASYGGQPIGSSKHPTAAACFSFHPIKNMTTAEGGMLTTGQAHLAEKARLWRFHGVARDAFAAYRPEGPVPTSYDVKLPGFKYNLSDLHAALGIWQLRKLTRMNARRGELAARYRAALANLPGLVLPGAADYPREPCWHLFTILVPADPEAGPDEARRRRAEVIGGLRERNVATGIHFEAVHLTSYYRQTLGWEPGSCPRAEDICARILSLPLFPGMADEDVDYVARALSEVLA